MKVMPLHSAVTGGSLAIVRALLDHRAPVNARQQWVGRRFTLLHNVGIDLWWSSCCNAVRIALPPTMTASPPSISPRRVATPTL